MIEVVAVDFRDCNADVHNNDVDDATAHTRHRGYLGTAGTSRTTLEVPALTLQPVSIVKELGVTPRDTPLEAPNHPSDASKHLVVEKGNHSGDAGASPSGRPALLHLLSSRRTPWHFGKNAVFPSCWRGCLIDSDALTQSFHKRLIEFLGCSVSFTSTKPVRDCPSKNPTEHQWKENKKE
jgi:hypothetical protein